MGQLESRAVKTVGNDGFPCNQVILASQDLRQKNRAIVLDEVPEGTQVKEIVSVGKPVKDLTVVIGNPKTKKVYSDLHIGEIFISGDSVANGY